MLFNFRTFSAIFLTFTCLIVLGQTKKEQSKTPEQLALDFIGLADEIMNETRAMVDAKEMYVQAAMLDPENIKANYLAGDFTLQTVGKDRAAQYFLKVKELDPEYRFDLDYKTGLSYQYGMNFQKALEYYEAYKEHLTASEGYRGLDMVPLAEVDRRIEECNNAIEFVANPANVLIKNVGTTINSPYEDYAPVLNEEEDFLIFTSRRKDDNLNKNVAEDNKPYEDIFFTRKKGDNWGYASNIGTSINTKYHNSNLAISSDGNTLFLYKDDINNGDIYVTKREKDTVWSEPVSIGDNINSDGFNESSVTISAKEDLLIFASNRPGGKGGIDLFYSIKNNQGEWGRASSLSETINTEFNEDGPFLDYDGKSLYFSSQGHKGMGGYDIFKTVYDSAAGKWSEPINIGYPINTPDDDIYFVTTKDGKRGYYASVREDGRGFTDIYMVTLHEGKKEEVEEAPKLLPVTVNLTVKTSSGEMIDANVSMKNIANNQVAGLTMVSEGNYTFTISNEEATTYRISAEAQGYVYETREITVPASSEEEQEVNESIVLRKPKVNTRKVLRNIYFNFDKASFKSSSFEELNKLHKMLADNTGMKVEISGHTDSIGRDTYNKKLSQQRANAVKKFLVEKGIDTRRITAVGYGEERPLASNDDEKEGRELNRRVEFKVIQ